MNKQIEMDARRLLLMDEQYDDSAVTPGTKEELDILHEKIAAKYGYICTSNSIGVTGKLIDIYRDYKETLWEMAHEKTSYANSAYTLATGGLEREMTIRRVFSVLYGAFYIEDVRQRVLKVVIDGEQLLKKFVKPKKTELLLKWCTDCLTDYSHA